MKLRNLRALAIAVLAFTSLLPGVGIAQEETALSAWQSEKCQLYLQNWERALDFFGTENLNYDFIAQNENFIASRCTAPPAVCAQSRQEIDIANALTIAMMNAGAASTFLPFRCQKELSQTPPSAGEGVALNSELCRSQLDFLVKGGKLMVNEAADFEAQCACFERMERDGNQTECAQ